jgi:hypothetical protein
MQLHRQLPDANRLSVVTATVLLAYALTPFVTLPDRFIALQLPGFLFEARLNFNTFVSILVAILAASGTDWLIQSHPQMKDKARLPHWLIPALTASVIGVPLTTLGVGLEWWVVFALGGVLFVLVLVAEYIVVDPADTRHAPASIGLTAVSFALYLVLTISLRAAGMRLYTLVLALAPAIFLVCIRSLFLRSGGRWYLSWSIGIALVISQVAAGLHYWPLTPLQFGLVILGLAYGLTSLASGIEEGRAWRTVWIEPVVMVTILWGIAFLLRT